MEEGETWTVVDHYLDATNDRLVLQISMRKGYLINLLVDGATELSDDVNWRRQLFQHYHDGNPSLRKSCMPLLKEMLEVCRQRYATTLPSFGNTLFLGDDHGKPTVLERMDPQIESALKTSDELFNDIVDLPPHVSRTELETAVVERGLFFPQTRPVRYREQVFVAKGPASVERIPYDFQEVSNLLCLPSQHANIMPPPAALVQMSPTDRRLCGFLTHLYENGNIDQYARDQREKGLLRTATLWKWFKQLVSATKFLIDAKTWHGDIKPDNILVSRDGDLILIDLSRKYTTMTIAPPEVKEEIYRSNQIEVPARWPISKIEKSEVYSIGRTMFFVAAGIAMKDVYMKKHGHDFPTEFNKRSPIPEEMQNLIQDCVHEDPTTRPTLHELSLRLSGDALRNSDP